MEKARLPHWKDNEGVKQVSNQKGRELEDLATPGGTILDAGLLTPSIRCVCRSLWKTPWCLGLPFMSVVQFQTLACYFAIIAMWLMMRVLKCKAIFALSVTRMTRLNSTLYTKTLKIKCVLIL